MKNTRRAFMQKLGAAMLTFSPATLAAFDSSNKLKIGLLIPKKPSEEIKHFISGLKLTQDFDKHFFIKEEAIRLSSAFKVEKGIKRLEEESVDVIISFANKRVSHHALDRIPDLKIPYLQSGLGANHCPKFKDRPFYFEHTLNYYEAAYLAGQYVAQNNETSAYLVAGTFDVGFDHLKGFQKGFESAGGQIVDTSIIQTNKDIKSTIKKIKAAQPDVVFSLFNDKLGQAFMGKLSQSNLSKSTQVLSNHPFQLKNSNSLNFKYLSGWSTQLTTTENIKFAKSYRKVKKQAPDAFAMLGYETGELLATSLKSNYRYVYNLTKTFTKSDMKGLRNSLKIGHNQVRTDFQWFTSNGKSLGRISDTLDKVQSYFIPDEGLVSGATNAYLPKYERFAV